MTQQPYDIYTLVASKLEPDLSEVPMTSALRDPCVVAHLATMAAMIANIAECLPRNEQVNLAETLGYKEGR
jgi:hypothetical protein